MKWFKNWCYQKMSITKNVLIHSHSSMKKKFRQIRMIFDIANWLWKSNIGTFWKLATTPIVYLVISFDYSWFLAKKLSNFVSLPLNLHNRYCHNSYCKYKVYFSSYLSANTSEHVYIYHGCSNIRKMSSYMPPPKVRK